MGTIPIKTPEQLQLMANAGKLAASVLEMIEPFVVPGVSTAKLDSICHDFILSHGAIPAPLNYKGFPKSVCTSINHVVCHGIPSEKDILKKGDIVNIDVTVILEGFHGDTSRMFKVGKVSPDISRLCQITQEAMYGGIRMVKPGVKLGDIGAKIESMASHYGIVEEYTGHGIGAQFHEPPHVFHYGLPGTGPTLLAGMCLTIEPMFNQGTKKCRVLSDGWTVITKDKRASAQYEHTVAVTETGFKIMTLRQEEVSLFGPEGLGR